MPRSISLTMLLRRMSTTCCFSPMKLLLRGTRGRHLLQLALVGSKPLAGPRHFGIELASAVTAGHRLLVGFTLFGFEPFEQAVSSPISLASRAARAFLLRASVFKLRNLAAISRSSRFMANGPSARCLPPVTVTLWKHSPVWREEEGVGIFECKFARDFGVGHDVAVAQLGKNHFERFAETVEHANAILQGKYAVRGAARVGTASLDDKRELRLRIVRDERGTWRVHRRRCAADAARIRRHPTTSRRRSSARREGSRRPRVRTGLRLRGSRRACRRRRKRPAAPWPSARKSLRTVSVE